MADTLDFNALYTVKGYRGVAFTLIDYGVTEEYEGDYLICDDENCDHQVSEMCWTEGETSIVTDLDWVRAVMVGDDREHLVEVSELTKIDESQSVCSCGQLGCGWG